MKTDWQFNVMHAGKTIPGRIELIRELEALGAGITTFEIGEGFVVHKLEGSENFDAVVELLKEAEKQRRIDLMILYRVTYNEKERSAAKWLHVRSANMRIDKGESEGSFEFQHFNGIRIERMEAYWGQTYEKKVKEYGHYVQIGHAYAGWKPNWRTDRQFCEHNVSCALFCSNEARCVIEAADLKGVEFRPVLSPKGQKPVDDLWQVWPQETPDFLAPGKYMECRPCKTCGEIRYVPQGGRGELLIREDRIPKDLDFMQTPPCYGAVGIPYYVISARTYQTLKTAKITRGLVFTPLDVIPT